MFVLFLPSECGYGATIQTEELTLTLDLLVGLVLFPPIDMSLRRSSSLDRRHREFYSVPLKML